jgi:hypothetical protein
LASALVAAAGKEETASTSQGHSGQGSREGDPSDSCKQAEGEEGWVDSDKESQSDQEADAGSDVDDGATDKATHATKTNPQWTEDGGTATLLALPSPRSAAKSRSSCYAFLESLSANSNYKRLLSLLHVARVSFMGPIFMYL